RRPPARTGIRQAHPADLRLRHGGPARPAHRQAHRPVAQRWVAHDLREASARVRLHLFRPGQGRRMAGGSPSPKGWSVMAQTPLIYVEGTVHKPLLVAEFGYHSRYAKRPQMRLVDFVKELPDRKWNPSQKVWTITGVGPEPERLLTEAGFDILWTGEAFDHIDSLDELVKPRAKLADNGGGVYIRPRLLGRKAIEDIIGHGAVWEAKKARFWVPLGEIAPVADQLDFMGDDILDAIDSRTSPLVVPDGAEDFPLAQMAQAVTADEVDDFADVAENFGDVPDWYGLDLFEYQRLGAIAAWGGFRMICDEPGLGKTRTAMAAAAMHAPKRVLISSPPVGVTHWVREATTSRLAWAAELSSGEMEVEPGELDIEGGPFLASARDERFEGRVVDIRSGRKIPELPERGIVVVADSFLSNKPELQAKLAEWAPDVFIDDEIHRHANITTHRTKSTISVSSVASYSYCITATPLMLSPEQIPSQLLITDTLDHFGGSVGEFLEEYCRLTKFGWMPRKKKSKELGRILGDHVWVRRTKAKAQPQLPKRARRVEWLDVPLKDYRACMTETIENMHELIERFVDGKGRLPKITEIRDVVPDMQRFASPLRRAAGTAKIPDAVEWAKDHLETTGKADDGGYDRPLILWVWH